MCEICSSHSDAIYNSVFMRHDAVSVGNLPEISNQLCVSSPRVLRSACPLTLFHVPEERNSQYSLHFGIPGMWQNLIAHNTRQPIRNHHHHHMSFLELGHLLTRSGLTYPEVSSKVYHNSFCQLGSCSVRLLSVRLASG